MLLGRIIVETQLAFRVLARHVRREFTCLCIGEAAFRILVCRMWYAPLDAIFEDQKHAGSFAVNLEGHAISPVFACTARVQAVQAPRRMVRSVLGFRDSLKCLAQILAMRSG